MSLPEPRALPLRYGAALATGALATLVRLLLQPAPGTDHPLFTFIVAVTVTSWYAGLGPALFTLGLGLIAADYFFVPPLYALGVTETPQLVGLGLYLFAGLTIILLGESLREARRRAQINAAAQAELAAIVASSHDAIIGHSLAGNITSWNTAAQRLFGYTPTEVLDYPIALLVPADRQAEVPPALERLRQGLPVEAHETVRVCKDGAPVPVSLTVSPVKDAAGQVIGAATIARCRD